MRPAVQRLSPLCLALLLCAPASAQPQIGYTRDIQPILSDACYHCHGPDENTREANLRLDTKEGTFRLKRGKAVIIPGDVARSELVRRITATDPDDQMPPPDSNRKLTGRQIELLKQWIAQGANWGEHWAFIPPKRPPLPQVANNGWPRNDIDRFVLARLEKERLGPSPQAARHALIRRVTLDLTGLPPTAAEIDAFVADTSADAYEKVVDRLLASPRYGERMATDWLDLARYADTHGYQMDRYRPTWPWRDWVIKAFNQNRPYDQFVTWQLAGDLLPNPTKGQRLATSFNRQHSQTEEGGVVEEEFRVAYVVDRVNTMGTAFLGLTLECSRCHDHKYDPIMQKDFYQLFAFFQNIDESGQTTYFTESTPVPTMLLSTDEQDKQIEELKRRIEAKQNELRAAHDAAKPDFEKWLFSRDPKGSASAPNPIALYSFEEIKNNKTHNAVDQKKPANAVEAPKSIPGKVGNAAELSGESGFTFPGTPAFTRADPFSLSIWLKSASHAARAVVVHKSKAPIDAGSRGYELLLENGKVAFGLHHMWPGNSLKVVTKSPVAQDEWTHVAATYDGSSQAAGLRIFVDGQAQPLETVRDNLYKDITYGGSEPDLAIGHRFRDNGFKNGVVDEFQVFDRALTPAEAAHLAGVDRPSKKALFEHYLATAHQPTVELTKQLHTLRRQFNEFTNPLPEAMVMRELPTPKPAYILKRGAYDAPGEKVSANTPAFLPPLAQSQISNLRSQNPNRLDLARWLLDPQHPLTARVTVNRLWQQMFGQGLVETADNFGRQGSRPTHPELLDYLARHFVDDLHWDTKRLLRTIALSATYRQSSKATLELFNKDPENQLLARGPARRLTAEMLRDQALFASGLLVEKLGGPSVKPYQPEGLWEIAMGRPKYDQSKGEGLYRRSLYTFWKRTVPPPAMSVFDAADRSVCTVKRQATSTPLQALALLNDVQLVEAARFIAQRGLKEAAPDQQIPWVFKLVAGRNPTPRETTILKQTYIEQRELFAADPTAAKKLLEVGESKTDPTLNPTDLAAATIVAQALLNHDEAIMRR